MRTFLSHWADFCRNLFVSCYTN